VHDNFGSDIEMVMNPFVMGSATKPECFDEQSPCTLEQTSMCVIDVTKKAHPQDKFPGQDQYVPWLVCMDSTKDQISKCNKEAGVDASAVSQCMKSDVSQLLKQYIKVDKPIGSTPTVHINGKNVNTSYKAIHAAICKADSSLKGCSADMPDWAGLEPEKEHVPPGGEIMV